MWSSPRKRASLNALKRGVKDANREIGVPRNGKIAGKMPALQERRGGWWTSSQARLPGTACCAPTNKGPRTTATVAQVTWEARRSFLRRGGLAGRLRRGGRRRGGRLSIGRRLPAN